MIKSNNFTNIIKIVGMYHNSYHLSKISNLFYKFILYFTKKIQQNAFYSNNYNILQRVYSISYLLVVIYSKIFTHGTSLIFSLFSH